MVETGHVLSLKGISKRYGGLQALDAVNLEVTRGEVHALIGENGAGKSTLMKVLGGIVKRDSGTIIFDGKEVIFNNPQDALKSGVAIIHQELSMLPELNILENVYMGRMPKKGFSIDWKKLEIDTRAQLEKVGFCIDPHTLVKTLSMSQRQLVEIAKALSVNASLIVMDEPSSSLAEAEVEKLFQVIADLKKAGIAVIYISHKLKEVLTVSDRITALKDGRYVDTIPASTASPEKLIQMMVGRDLLRQHLDRGNVGPTRLKVRNLSGAAFKNVSFDLKGGEVLGFAGLVGAGRSELARTIFGADPRSAGSIELEGQSFMPNSPSDAIAAGIAMVAEDRKSQSLFLDLPIRTNMTMARLPKLSVRGRVREELVTKLIDLYQSRLDIKMKSADDPVKSLSGGNQQKTILARWLATEPKVLILDEPTHGIDVGAKSEIYRLIRDLAKEGMSIMLISSELAEIIAMSDRVVVMHEGEAKAILPWDKLTEETIMSCATGNVGHILIVPTLNRSNHDIT
ncbi:sugar ABC transporter ATP-binding protein [Treponema sp.]